MTAGMIPSRTSVKPNTASGCATAMSAHATSPEPPPSAYPWTRQTTGAGQESIASEHPEEAHRVLDVLVVGEVDRGALPLDVGAGAEAGALAGEHDGACVSDVGERFRQLGDERRVEGVPPVGAGERDAQNVAVAFDPKSLHRRNHMVSAWP